MPSHALSDLLRQLRTIDPATDGDLLDRYLILNNQEAFETLVRRHHSTVLSACRQVLTNGADIDDVFQATFLILLSKARSARWRPSLGGWLYAVAHRVAVRLRRTEHRRIRRETQVFTGEDTNREQPDFALREVIGVLHEELDRLPDRYRFPLLLCYLEGLSRDEAATQLGWTLGTLRGRLARGRRILHQKLARRGISLSVGLLVPGVHSGNIAIAISPNLVAATLGAARGAGSTKAQQLARTWVSGTGFRMKTTLVVIAVFGLCLGLLAGEKTPEGASKPSVLTASDEKKPVVSKTTRADRLRALQKKFDSEISNFFWSAVYSRRSTEAKEDPERKAVQDKIQELTTLIARDALVIANEDPKDAVGFEAAMFIAGKISLYGRGKEFEAALTLIGDHHLNNAQIRELFPRIALCETAGLKFTQTVSEKAIDKEVKGIALFALGVQTRFDLRHESDASKRDELIARAIEYFQKAAQEAPDTEAVDGTIGKTAATNLIVLNAMKSVVVGKLAPDIEGSDLGAKKIKLSSYKGKVVLMDIWATWCPPCREMIPHEREIVKKLKGKPFALLGISCDVDKETLTRFLDKEPMPWDHWFDGSHGSVVEVFHTRAWPTLFLIDHTGVIRKKWVGKPDDMELDKAIEELVKEAETAKG